MALILVADDEPDIASLLATVLTSAGHTVHTASDGETALAQISSLRPDLTILDHYMPRLTGLEAAQRLRADPATRSLPLLMLSAAAPPTALLYCNVVLAKPVSLSHFTMVVRDLLNPPPSSDPLRDLGRVRAVSSLLDAYTDTTAGLLGQLARETAEEVDARMAAVTMVLVDAVAVYAAHGLGGWVTEAGGMPAEWAPCTRVIRTGAPALIDNLSDDPAFTGTPLVTVDHIRSYAGVPLPDAAGHHVGTVNVMSREPAAFTEGTLSVLAARTPAVTKLLLP